MIVSVDKCPFSILIFVIDNKFDNSYEKQSSRYFLPSTVDLVVCNHFRLIRKLGTGAFGEIYLAENKNNPSEKYAAKLEEANTKFPQLYFEAKMYKYLNSSMNVVGIPKVHAVTT